MATYINVHEQRKQENEKKKQNGTDASSEYVNIHEQRRKVNQAYELLGNPTSKEEFDERAKQLTETINTRMQDYTQKYNDFFNTYQSADNINSYSNSLITEAKELQEMLSKYGIIFEDDYVSEASNWLSSVESNVKKGTEHWSQWETEDDYNTAVRMNGYYTKYQGMSAEDEAKALEDLNLRYAAASAVGSEEANLLQEEIDYLYTYGSKETQIAGRKKKYEQNQKEIERLEKEIIALGGEAYVKTDAKGNTHAVSAPPTASRSEIPNQQEADAYIEKENANTAKIQELSAKRDALIAENIRYDRGEGVTDAVYAEYKYVTEKPDYAELSKAGESKLKWGGFAGDDKYDYINDINGLRMQYSANATINGGSNSYEIYDHMTEYEIGVYNYLYATEGKDSANAYLKKLKSALEVRSTDANTAFQQKMVAESPLYATVANIGSVITKPFGDAISFIDNTANQLQGEDINPYSQWQSLRNTNNAIRSATTQVIEANTDWEFLGQNVWGQIYNAGMSTVDSIYGAAMFGSAYTFIAASGAAANKAAELYEKGATSDQIFWGGTTAGLAEYVFEKISIDNLIKTKNPDSMRRLVLEIFKQGGIEASEEVLTEISNTISDSIIMGSQSDLSLAIKAYQEDGLSYEEAYKKALQDKVADIAWAGISGFLSGGASGSLTTAPQAIKNTYAGSQIKKQGDTEAMILAGIDASQDSQAYGLAEKAFRDYTEGSALYRFAERVAGTDSKLAKTVDKLGGGKGNVSSMRLGALKQTTKEDVVNQYRNRESLSESDIKAKLESKGIDSTKAAEFASIVTKLTRREKLQEREIEALNENIDVKDVAEEILSNQAIEKFSTMSQIAKIDSLGREKVAETPDTYSVSDVEGKTLMKDSGAEVTIEDIASIEDGKMMLKVNDGTETKVVNAENISFASNKEAVMYEMVAGMDIDAASAKAIIGNFDAKSGITAGQYILGVQEAFNYGKYNFAPEEMSKIGFSADLTQAQKTFAYNLGKNVHITNVNAQESAVNKAVEDAKTGNKVKGGKKGNVHYEGVETASSAFTERQKTSIQALETIAKALGIDIYLYESKLDDKGRRAYTTKDGKRITANGWYDTKTGDIHIDINAGNKGEGVMLFTAAHELTHFIRQWSPAKFKVLADFLMAEYGKAGVPVAELVRAQQNLAAKQGRKISYDTAYEEMIADSMQTMLSDGAIVEKLAKLAQKDKNLVEKMKEWLDKFVAKIKEAYTGMTPDSKEGRYGAMLNEAERLRELFYDALVDAGAKYSEVRKALGKGATIQVNKNGEFTVGQANDGTVLYNERTYDEGGRDTLEETLKAEGFSESDIKAALTIIDAKHELVKRLGEEFVAQDTANKATITTDIKNGNSVLSALVKNGDYPVNIDLLTICKKRQAYQRVISRLCDTGLIEQATLDSLAIAEINKILGKYGFETACLGCFVESKRLRIKEYAETICKEWNGLVDKKLGKGNAKLFGFSKDTFVEDLTETEVLELTKEYEQASDKEGKINVGTGSYVKKFEKIMDSAPSLRKHLSISDIATPQGMANLKSVSPELFALVASRYGSGSPKPVQNFNPYNSELAKYGSKPNAYSSLREYLYAIGGARMQSFSDFIIENWFDYCQIVADLAARKLPMHTYTKEISLAKLFGMTGIKVNMSLIPDIDRSLGKEYAGLTKNANGEYELIWADKDRFKATGGKSYMQSINFADAIALQNDPRYSSNVGTIAIGLSDMHIRMMLNDSRIRQVIPYHSSAINPIFADLVGVSYYNDYTDYQTTKIKEIYDSNGKVVNLKLTKDQVAKWTAGFEFNQKLQEIGDARATAQAYIEWCADASQHTMTINGQTYTATLTPKFDAFSKEQNYYKLLADFNTYDCITEQAAPQGDVQQIYPDNFEDVLREELTHQENYRNKQEPKWDVAMEEIESYLKKHTKAETVAYADERGIKLSKKERGGIPKPKKSNVKLSARDYSYEALTSKPDMKITTVGGTVPNNRADVVFMAKKNAASVGKFHKDGSVSVYVDDIGTEVILATKGLRHGLRRTQDAQNETNYIVTLKAGEILKNSIRINELNPSKENASGSYVLIGTAQNKNGDLYIVQSVINQFNNELDSMDVLYAINAKKELAVLNAPRLTAKPLSVTNSTISIAELLDYVNQYFPDVLPESVLRHYQHNRRPEGELGENALFSERNTAPTFYSKMGRVVEDVKQEKLGASSVIPMLTGKGVKAEEIRWSGIQAFLEGKKSVTKQELLEFINGSMLEIGEQTSSNDIDLRYDGNNRAYSLYDESGNVVNTFTYNEFMGGYVSENDDEIYTNVNEIEDALREEYGSMSSPRWADYKLYGGSNYREIVFTLPNSSYSNQMMRIHWGEDAEGIIAHARIQDFDVNGKKILFIEEIQSDYHNEGHKDGYQEDAKFKEIQELEAKANKAFFAVEDYSTELTGLAGEYEAVAKTQKGRELLRAKFQAEKELKQAQAQFDSKVPDAPFKDTYHEFVLKRLLRMAAEQGYDSIGWTPANIQTQRWSDEFAEGYRIEYDQDMPKFLNKYGRQWGAKVSQISLNNESNVVTYTDNNGKEHKSIREWYDSVMDGYVEKDQAIWNKYIMGQVKVIQDGDTMRIQIKETEKLLDEALTINYTPDTVWSMDITDSMKNSVLYEGQPLYSERNPDAVSNRSLLANALEGAVQNDIEKNKLKEYKEKIDFINAEERKLADLNRQLNELRFSKGKRDTIKTKQINDLQAEATKTANRISIYDKQLLRLEATTALKNVLEREKTKAMKRQKQKDAEILQAQKDKANATIREIMNRHTESRKKAVEGRNKTVVRNKIKRVIKDLNQVFNKGTKERNVKIGLRDTVRKALEAAVVLFSDEITNEDIVRLGVDSVSAEEHEKLERYSELLMGIESAKQKSAELAQSQDFKKDSIWAKDIAYKINENNKRIVSMKNQISKLNSDLKDVFIRERARLNKETVSAALDSLAEAYASLQNSDDDYIKNNAFVQGMHDRIKSLSDSLNGVIIKDMSLEQLEDVYKMYSSIRHMIVSANSIFRDGLREDLSKKIMTVQGEILELQKDNKKDPSVIVDAINNAIKSFDWNNQKPVYAFEKLGSKAFQELFWDAIKAEGVYAQDVNEAGDFLDAQKDKFKYADWDFKKAKTFKSANGLDFKLTLADMMSIYAYSKRPQAFDHMTQGGFTFDRGSVYVDEKGRKRKHVRLSETYTVSIELINEIVNTLTEEQIGYVDAVQAYLTSLGEKGNEVSRTLYGIDLFTEKVYFPLKSDADYRSSVEQALNETQTQVSLKNTGMTKQTVPHANNPIVLQGFDDVVLGHVDNMSKYHSFVLPIENLRRVFDNVSRDENASYDATKVIIESVFGESAKQYFDQYITDLNGGVHIGGYQNIFMDMFSKMKKTAVSASLSVVVQQPFAITRAMDMINPVYFAPVNFEAAKKTTDSKSQWEELKKYAPIAIIKEMGGFDVGSSRTTRDYIGGKKSLDDIFMWGASKADEIGWSTIWKAVKREVAAQNKELAVGSEEFLQKCGERFTEVVVYTQVYDSVNSRSGMMRSKRDLDKFATSFMGEPTTTINMIENRMLQLARAVKTKDGKAIAKASAKMGRTTGVVLGSILLTSLAKSLVYAGRDDDEEDKALLERWAKHFGDSLTNDLNPLTMIPYLRDFVSIWEGWDIERPDMTIVADIVTSIKKAVDEGCTVDEALALIGNVANAFGLPAKNIIREAQGVINVFGDITDNIEATDIVGAFMEGWTGEEKSTKDSLYQAIINGDKGKIEVLKSTYKTEDAYEQALRKALRENDSRIREAAQARIDSDIAKYSAIVREIKAEGNFSQDTIVAAVNAEINLINKEAKEQNASGNDEIEDTEEKATSIYKASDINAAFDNGDTNTALAIIEDLVSTKVANGMTEKEAKSSVKSSMTSYWKPLFLEAYKNKDTNEQKRIRQILLASGLYGKTSEVIDTTQQWIKDSKKKK